MPIAGAAQFGRSRISHPQSCTISRVPQGTMPATASAVADLAALRTIGTNLRFHHNQTIFNEGDAAEHAYRVVSGAVRLCKYLADGRRQIVQFLFRGDFFSFMELAAHRLTAEAVNEVVLTSYPQRQITNLGTQDPSIKQQFVALLSQRLQRMQDHLMLLGRQTALERVSSFLLSLKERLGCGEGEAMEIPMSRQDIADYLGLTIETVCRVLTKLRRSRTIRIPNLHQLVLDDLDALYAVAEGGD
jgi:CRP-like cAMP-binding protein